MNTYKPRQEYPFPAQVPVYIYNIMQAFFKWSWNRDHLDSIHKKFLYKN